jgi:hypothetical protein
MPFLIDQALATKVGAAGAGPEPGLAVTPAEEVMGDSKNSRRT